MTIIGDLLETLNTTAQLWMYLGFVSLIQQQAALEDVMYVQLKMEINAMMNQ